MKEINGFMENIIKYTTRKVGTYMTTGILIISGFVIFAVLMATKKLSTLLALPLMAAWVAGVAGLSLPVYLNTILLGGAMKLGSAMAVVIFGAMFARVIMKTGIADALIKTAAELAGDQPVTIALVMSLATVFVFLGLSGLGAVIMVGSIALPIMTGAGIKPVDAVVLQLFALGTGLAANTANYGLWIGIFGGEAVPPYYLPAFLVTLLAMLSYLCIHVRQPEGGFAPGRLIGGFLSGVLSLPGSLIRALLHALHQKPAPLVKERREVPAAAFLAPLLPIIIVFGARAVFGFGKAENGMVDPVAAALFGFVFASLYAALLVRPGQVMQIFTGALVDGIRDVAGVIFLFMGIGMLVASVMHPQVAAVLDPMLRAVVPQSHWALFAFFTILSPAALYRGPLNMFGMGAGIAVLMMSLGTIPAAVLCGIFIAVANMQAADPTNSQNVWLSGFANVDPNDVLKKMLPFAWAECCVLMLYVTLTQW